MNNTSATAPPASENVRGCPLSAESLSDQQLAAIRLMVIGRSLSTVAKAVAISPRQLYRWRHTDVFRRELQRLRHQLWSEAADRLRSLVHPSLDVLEEDLRKRHRTASFRAANAVLRHSNLGKSVPIDDALDDDDDPAVEE